MSYISWGFQILILTAGIHLFLRFVRTTRGNPLIRGLFMSVLVGVVGLWMLAKVLQLEELEEILESSTGLIVVGLVIIFHPELRRGIGDEPGVGPKSRGGRIGWVPTCWKLSVRMDIRRNWAGRSVYRMSQSARLPPERRAPGNAR